MDKNRLAGEYADTYGNMGSDAWNNAYTCYLAGFEAAQQLLQQTQCTTLREGLEQMLKDAKKQCVETKGMIDSVWHTANVKKIENVIKLIDEYPPVA